MRLKILLVVTLLLSAALGEVVGQTLTREEAIELSRNSSTMRG